MQTALDSGSSEVVHPNIFFAGMRGLIPPHPLTSFAGMAELADALDSGSSEVTFVQVQVLLPAPNQYNPNRLFYN